MTPIKNWAILVPSPMAGVLLYIWSVATDSQRLGMLSTGFGDLTCWRRLVPSTAPLEAYWVVASRVFLIVSRFAPTKICFSLRRSFFLVVRTFHFLGGRSMPVAFLGLLLNVGRPNGVSDSELSLEDGYSSGWSRSSGIAVESSSVVSPGTSLRRSGRVAGRRSVASIR